MNQESLEVTPRDKLIALFETCQIFILRTSLKTVESHSFMAESKGVSCKYATLWAQERGSDV